jgi:hypothetical protein
MTPSQTDPGHRPDHPTSSGDVAAAAGALAVVLDLEADELRADSPLVDLGADAMARTQWADIIEESSAEQGARLVVDDEALRTATTAVRADAR